VEDREANRAHKKLVKQQQRKKRAQNKLMGRTKFAKNSAKRKQAKSKKK
jgi:hypothetical protein